MGSLSRVIHIGSCYALMILVVGKAFRMPLQLPSHRVVVCDTCLSCFHKCIHRTPSHSHLVHLHELSVKELMEQTSSMRLYWPGFGCAIHAFKLGCLWSLV